MAGKPGALSTKPTELPARDPLFPWRKLDGRSVAAREIAEDLWELWTALGGVGNLSPQRRWLSERVVTGRRQLIEYETVVELNRARGPDDQPLPLPMTEGEAKHAAATLQGHLKTLGLDRVAGQIQTAVEYIARARDVAPAESAAPAESVPAPSSASAAA